MIHHFIIIKIIHFIHLHPQIIIIHFLISFITYFIIFYKLSLLTSILLSTIQQNYIEYLAYGPLMIFLYQLVLLVL